MIVVKIGGGKEINYDFILRDLARYKDVVLVHGGNHELNELQTKLGNPPKMVTSVSGYESRYTNRETLEMFWMAYCGKVNKMIVEKLQKLGINAVGLSGMDGRILEGKRKDAITIIDNGKKKVLRNDYTGKIENVNVMLLRLLMDNGFFPVITPPGISFESDSINVDGDRAAAAIAEALHAECLIMLSNVPGLLKEVNDESSLIANIKKDEAAKYMDVAQGRMKKKIMGAIEALQHGVHKVIFADARIENPITEALKGKGTVIE